MLTHGHPDQVGGLTDAAGNLNYPNAQYYMTKTEWEFWNNAPIPKGQELNFPVACKTLPVIKKRVTRIDYGQEILPGITVLAASGHTPGHLGLIIASGSETLLH
ncbi:MAG: MBL fold metallo-hydrolase, partial [Acidobacteriota bacterium]|nr:MBL fold metallo-hydrolase [Acidobacteriota bacterium]